MNRDQVVAGLAEVRRDKAITDAVYDRATILADRIGSFPEGRDDNPELLALMEEGQATVEAYRAHIGTGPAFDEILVRDRVTGELVSEPMVKTTYRDSRGRTITMALDPDGPDVSPRGLHGHRLSVQSQEETDAADHAAIRAPYTFEEVHRARQEADAKVQAVLNVFREGHFDEGVKQLNALPTARSYEAWGLLDPEIREYLMRSIPPLPLEGNIGS